MASQVALKQLSSVAKVDDSETNPPLLAETAGFTTDETGSCPIREVLDRVGDTWSLLVILNLQQGTVRFNALRRLVEGISQRMLTVTLRSLERDGLVLRKVRPTSPPEVEYSLTALGQSLAVTVDVLGQWAVENRHTMRNERERFDAAVD